jgi:uncharacterized delta-60 repeat protein
MGRPRDFQAGGRAVAVVLVGKELFQSGEIEMFSINRAKNTRRRHALRQAIESLENRVLLAYTLDPNFSGDGISEVAGTSLFAVQPDNKIVALVPDTTTPRIARLLSDGSLDTSFGSGGQVALPFAPLELAFSNGKILVASTGGLAIARYNLNGTLDTTFGGDGIAQAPSQYSATANDMAVAPDGKLVLVGSGREVVDISHPSDDRAYYEMARFNSDGSLDTSFAGDGVYEELVPEIHNGGFFNTGVQSDGKIIVVGWNSFSVMDGITWRMDRLNVDGSGDSSFQEQGWSNGDISDLEIQADDKILLIRDFELLRYNANGPFDKGLSVTGLGNSNVRGSEPLSNGNVLVAGIDAGGSFVARLLLTGEADTTFGPSGKVYLGSFQASDVQLDSLSRAIAGGFNPTPRGNLAAIARLANITQSPFKGSPFNVGDTIQAEDFDLGGQNLAYSDTDATNNGGAYRPTEGVDIEATSDTGGGFDVGWTMPGEWVEYTINIPTAGLYDMQTRIASPKAGGSFHYSLDDGKVVADRQTIPNTGSFQNWTTITVHLPRLEAGTHVLRLNMDFVSTGGGMANFNWLKLVPVDTGGGGGTGSGLTAQYFNNSDFTALVFTRNDANINFNWGTGSPDPRIDPDTFSVRWTGKITAPTTGRYTFYTTTDDGLRLWINNQLLIDHLTPQAATEWSGSIDLVAGQKYDIRMDYFERAGGAQAKLSWSGPGITKQIVPASAFSGGSSSSDTTPPSMVGSFGSSRITQNEVDVQWTPATDNVGVAGYELRLNSGGAVVVGPDIRTFAFKNLQPSTSYLFSINAFDAAGNRGLPTNITATTPPATTGGNGLSGTYFNNMDFTAPVFTRRDSTINFNWGTGSPDPRIDVDTFSVRWSGQIQAPTTGRYTFYTTSDDGMRLTINGQRIIDKLVPQSTTEWSGSIDLVAGQRYSFTMEYFDRFGGAQAKLQWAGPGIAKGVVPQSAFTPT